MFNRIRIRHPRRNLQHPAQRSRQKEAPKNNVLESESQPILLLRVSILPQRNKQHHGEEEKEPHREAEAKKARQFDASAWYPNNISNVTSRTVGGYSPAKVHT